MATHMWIHTLISQYSIRIEVEIIYDLYQHGQMRRVIVTSSQSQRGVGVIMDNNRQN